VLCSAEVVDLRGYLDAELLVAEHRFRVDAELLIRHWEERLHWHVLQQDTRTFIKSCHLDRSSKIDKDHLKHILLHAFVEFNEAVLATIGVVLPRTAFFASWVGACIIEPFLIESYFLNPDFDVGYCGNVDILVVQLIRELLYGLQLNFGFAFVEIALSFMFGEEAMRG
jgi:hypothetical protein